MESTILLLPRGLSLPPWPYLVAVLIGLAGVLGVLWRQSPQVTDGIVAGLSAWVVTGGVYHAMFQRGLLPDPVAPFFGTAAVYLTVAVFAGASWALGEVLSRQAMVTGTTGLLGGGLGLGYALATGPVGAVGWAVSAIGASVVVTALAWRILTRRRPAATGATGAVGLVVVFGHVLDGVSTAIGYDFLGAGERTPLPALILEAGSALPTAPVIGAGWLFILVKLGLAVGIVVLFRDLLTDAPVRGRLLLFLIAAIGLGPGSHNVVLYLLG